LLQDMSGSEDRTRPGNAVQNVATIWTTMDLRRRMIVAAATLGVFLAVLGLARMTATPQMALLYSGLDGAAAGEVVAALGTARRRL
jgi:flagellar M-ring protein FliF